MLKIVGPIALAIITISASGDKTTNGLQRRLLSDDKEYKPSLDIWNDKHHKDYDYNDKDKKDKDDDKLKIKKDDNDNNGKYIDDNHRYSQYKPYYHDNNYEYGHNNNDRKKGWNAGYASNHGGYDNYKPYDNDRQNKWNNDYGSDQYYDKQDYNKKGVPSDGGYYKGWKNNNHYEPDNAYYGANRGGYSNNWKNNGNDYSPDLYNKQDKRDYDHGYDKQKYNDDDSGKNVYRPYHSTSSNQYDTRPTGWDNQYSPKPKPTAMYVSEAIVILNVGDGSGVDGFIKFQDIDYGKKTKITAKITGLKPGYHGWHIHQFGDIFTDGCASAGPHYNPLMVNHGSADNDKYNRHIGDLGNIEADEYGVAHIEQYDDIIQLNGPYSIIGRGFVIHSDSDDLGRGGNDESLQTGNAGDRIACGVIGIKKED